MHRLAPEYKPPIQSLSGSSVRSMVSPFAKFTRIGDPSRLIPVRSITSTSTLGLPFREVGSVFALFRELGTFPAMREADFPLPCWKFGELFACDGRILISVRRGVPRCTFWLGWEG